MASRKSFLRALANGPAEVEERVAPKEVTSRRAYLESLGGLEVAGRRSSSSSLPSSGDGSVISFSLQSLRNFVAVNKTLGQEDGKADRKRKRPNYDNSRRRLFAQPHERIKRPDECVSVRTPIIRPIY